MTTDHPQVRLRHVPPRPLYKDFRDRKKFRTSKENCASEQALTMSAKMILLTAIERNRPAEANSPPDPSVRIQVIDPIELKDFIEGNRFWRSELIRIKGCGRAILHEIEQYASASGIDTGVSALDSKALESVPLMWRLSNRAIKAIRILTNTDVPTFQTLYDLIRENPDWCFDVFCLRNCGWKTMTDILHFADHYALLPKSKGTMGRFSEKAFFDEAARRKKGLSANPERQSPHIDAQREGRSEPPPTNI